MDRNARKGQGNWMITVDSTEQQHQEIILSTIAKRAHQIFEERGCERGDFLFQLGAWSGSVRGQVLGLRR